VTVATPGMAVAGAVAGVWDGVEVAVLKDRS
jgi:hypothetical protein